MQRAVQAQLVDVQRDLFREVLGETLHVKLVQEALQDAAFLDADRVSEEPDGNARAKRLALLELVEVDVEDLAGEVVLLVVLDEDLVDPAAHVQLDNRVFRYPPECVAELPGVHVIEVGVVCP